MSKDESTGLFSKVVKFVRNPGATWADGGPDSEHESAYSRQMLKEMIERKRRNDFVRKREFDMLRKMRRSEVMAGQDPAARPSFFQSSMPSRPDDRASTLKKIDEIEAQMSMQWWKTKHGSDPTRSANSTQFPTTSSAPPDASPRPLPAGTVQGALAPAGAAPAQPPQPPAPLSAGRPVKAGAGAYVRTEPQPLVPAAEPAPAVAPAPMLDSIEPAGWRKSVSPQAKAGPPSLGGGPRHPVYAGSESGGASGFSASKVFAIDVEEFAHDPELEEASIRFANGDDAGAEAGLMEVLAPGGSRIDHDETWLTLFDLYRATGQQDRFETAAIDFAGRFGRSAPQWISLPEAVGRMGPGPAAPAAGGAADWTCPSTLGTQTLAALKAALGRSAQPWRLSWAKLASIEEAATEGLAQLFTQWAGQPVQLRFIGADNLERILRNATPSGDKGVDPGWWKLRMEVLRVMHRPDEFELVALDYCVTYEVSPPSWESARCDYTPLQADGSAMASNTIVGEAFRDSITSGFTGFGETLGAPSSQMASVATVELAGQVLGEAKEAIALLDGKLAGADFMVISCAQLIRIDFTAAGTLLNWVSARQGEGRQVQFIDVNRLVAAFFNVIGIGEHARVSARKD